MDITLVVNELKKHVSHYDELSDELFGRGNSEEYNKCILDRDSFSTAIEILVNHVEDCNRESDNTDHTVCASVATSQQRELLLAYERHHAK